MKTRTLVGAMVLGVAMLLGGSKTSDAAWGRPYYGPRVAVRTGFRGFYRPWAFRPYFFAPGPRFVVRPYFRPHVSYFRAW